MVDVSGVSVFTKHVRQGPQPRTPYATSTARSDGIEEDYQVVENQGNLNLVLRSCNCPYFVNPRATSFFFILHFPSLGLHNKLALNQISFIGHEIFASVSQKQDKISQNCRQKQYYLIKTDTINIGKTIVYNIQGSS